MKKQAKKKETQVNDDVETLQEDAPEAGGAAPGETDDATESDETADTAKADDLADIPEAAVSEAEEEEEILTAEEEALEALEQERDALKDQLLRSRAEFDNYRKRMARESDQIKKTAAQGLMRNLLPILDNLERALDHAEDKNDGFAQGVEMIVKQFAGVLQNEGLEPITAVGEPFDPNVHEALTYQPSEEYGADTVMQEFQRGYRLGDYVLRPSQVIVSSGAPVAAPEAEATETEATETNAAETGDGGETAPESGKDS